MDEVKKSCNKTVNYVKKKSEFQDCNDLVSEIKKIWCARHYTFIVYELVQQSTTAVSSNANDLNIIVKFYNNYEDCEESWLCCDTHLVKHICDRVTP